MGMLYNIGDRVRIVSTQPMSGSWNSRGLMNKWLGQTMTIRDIVDGHIYKMEEDFYDYDGNSSPGWNWSENFIECLVEPESDEPIDSSVLDDFLNDYVR